MEFINFITENALILIPFLYVIGAIMKGTSRVSDELIPVILLPIGIVSSVALTGLSMESVIQGVLITGATVYTNQLIKQGSK